MNPPETMSRRDSLRRSRSAAGSSGVSAPLSWEPMDPPIEKAMFRVEPDEAGQRLDAFLARRDSSRSRSRYQTLIREARVTIDGAVAMDPNLRLSRGAAIV